MTEDDLYSPLRGYLLRIAADARALDPAFPALTDVIRAYQTNAPRLQGAYATIAPLSATDSGEAECYAYRDVTISSQPRVAQKVTRVFDWVWQVDVFAQQALRIADLFCVRLSNDVANAALHPFCVRRVGAVRRLPELIGQAWEGRAQFELTLGAPLAEEGLIDVIERGRVVFEAEDGFSASVDFEET